MRTYRQLDKNLINAFNTAVPAFSNHDIAGWARSSKQSPVQWCSSQRRLMR